MATPEQEKLFNKHIRLVDFMLSKLHIYEAHDESFYQDCRSEGYKGLFGAVKTFDESRGIKFSVYGCMCIRNAILMFIRNTKQKAAKRGIFCVSLGEPVSEDGQLTIEDELESPEKSVEETIIEEETRQELLACLVTAADPKRQEVYLGFLEGYSNRALGARFGMSQSYANRIIHGVERRIREVYKFMEGKLDKPKRNQFNSDKEYRNAYQKYYYRLKKAEGSLSKHIHEESPKIKEVIPTKANEEKRSALIEAVKKKLERAKKDVLFFESLLKQLEGTYD